MCGGSKKLQERTAYPNYYWVTLEHHIQYKSQVFLNEELITKTFVKHPEGLKFPRIIGFYKDNKLVFSAATNCFFVGAKTHKPMRIPKLFLELFNL